MILFRVTKKFGQILNHHQKVRVLELIVMMAIGSFMEMLSVSLMIPFMNAVMNPEATMKKSYARLICRVFHISDDNTRGFLIALALMLAALYIIKNMYLLIENKYQTRFVNYNMFLTQQKLLHIYLHRPYEYFLSVQTSEVLQVISGDVSAAFAALTTLLSIFTEGIVAAVLVVTLIVVDPVITIGIAIILIAAVLIITNFIKPILEKAGEENRDSAAGLSKWMIQSIQGIKEVKVMQKEDFFEERFESHGKGFVHSTQVNNVYGKFPRFFIEAVSMASIFIMMAIMIAFGVNLVALIPTLSVLAMAAIRLLPAVNRMSIYLGTLAYQGPMVDKLIENLNDVRNITDLEYDDSKGQIVPLQNECGLTDVSYHYPNSDADQMVLEGASMMIHKGESVGIMGPSGAGKTTTVDILLGLLHPQKGKVVIDGTDIRLDRKGWLAQIGYIPQFIFMLDGNIRDNVAFGIPYDQVDDDKVWKALEEASLADFVRTLPDGLETMLGERGMRFSGGQRQRIGIARALYTDPSILLFDEATSALDNDTEKAIMESINHLHGHKTMVIIAHRLTTIENCDHIFEVRDKKITRVR